MKQLFIFLIAIAGMVTACQKSNSTGQSNTTGGSSNTGTGTSNLVKSITSVITTTTGGNDTASLTFSYDGQGNCIQEVSGKDTTVYTYTPTTLISATGMYVTTYFLNASGSADSAHFVVNSPGFSIPGGPSFPPSISTTLFRYFYDANGYLSKSYAYLERTAGDSLEDARQYTVSNGNTTSVYDSIQNTTLSYTFSSQTTTTAPLPPDPLIGATGAIGTTVASNLLGHPNLGLLVTLPTNFNNVDYITTFSYVLDSKGRISTVTQKSPPGAPLLPAISYYTYY